MPIALTATTKARHVPHHFAMGDLELIQALHFRIAICHETRPHHLRQITIGLIGHLEPAETNREVFVIATRPAGS